MTAEKTAPPRRPDSPSPARSGLSPLQVIAGGLAASSAAVVASFFGVAGTVIGAALASVVASLSAALYGESLRRTEERLRRLRGGRSSAPAAAAPLPPRLSPRRAPAPRRRPRWSRVALGAAAAFGLAMVLITTVELIGQRPVSALVGASSHTSTTTVGEITGGGGSHATVPTTPAPSTSSATPDSGATGTSATQTPGSTTSHSAATSSATPTRGPAAPSQDPGTTPSPTRQEGTTPTP